MTCAAELGVHRPEAISQTAGQAESIHAASLVGRARSTRTLPGLQAAQGLSTWQGTVCQEAARLERGCGGPLVNRNTRLAGARRLTPLGLRLCQTAIAAEG